MSIADEAGTGGGRDGFRIKRDPVDRFGLENERVRFDIEGLDEGLGGGPTLP